MLGLGYIINRQSPTLHLPYGGSLSIHVVFHIPLVIQAATYHEEVRREKNEMNNSAGIHDQEYISLSYVKEKEAENNGIKHIYSE